MPTPVPCPRCTEPTADVVAASPVAGVWQVLRCPRCRYLWRTTEPARRTTPRHYPAAFRLTDDDLANAPDVPAVPPLD